MLCRSMQGRLFVVPWGKDYFIKACVCLRMCIQPGQTGIRSHTYWIHCSLALLNAHTLTLWVSRNGGLVTLLMNPSVVFQLTPLHSSYDSPESSLFPEPSFTHPLYFPAPSCLKIYCLLSLTVLAFFLTHFIYILSAIWVGASKP